jgi:ATP-dependent Clp protease ATP-binding subunit ClpC
VLAAIEPTNERRMPEPKLTPQAKYVLDLAAKEARSLKHSYIGTEHLLLALLREKKGTAAQVLAQLGLSWPGVREQILLYLGSEREGSDWEAVHDAGMVQILDWMLQDDNDARRILAECGLDIDAARLKAKQFLADEA